MSSEKDLLKLFLESGWIVAVIGMFGMLARLLVYPLKNAGFLDYFKRILIAAITSTISWFIIEQLDISSVTKAISYGVIGVISPEIINALVNLARKTSKNPEKYIK